MKKAVFALIPIIMFVMGCAGGAKPASSDGMTLDQALKEAADRIDERIPAGAKIAPLNFNSPHDKFSGYALDELSANLVESRKLIVVDRKEIDLIRSEFDFQFSGEVGDDSMQALGRMLGAQLIISGSLTDMGGFYRIAIRVLNVQNASWMFSTGQIS
ncbi:MAG: CsgG/HfaB family protein [Treponema sp.]|jgi:TolB-like protein|nr:CsgG/HfaB family protein [Treponema sp.]